MSGSLVHSPAAAGGAKPTTFTTEDALPCSNENNKNDLVKKRRTTWARLLKRVFDVDVETCGVCGGKVKIIAAIKKPEVIKKILDHIGLPSVPPEIASARGPPIFYDEEFNHDTNLISNYLPS